MLKTIDINYEINRLINFALVNSFISNLDIVYSSNMLIEVLEIDEFTFYEVDENLSSAASILNNMLDYAVQYNIIENTLVQRDLFDTKIMNCIMPRPSQVIKNFEEKYSSSIKEATNYFYNMSRASNYIRKERTDKNILWKSATEYGELDITINLSKPEKDPNDIAKAKVIRSTSYPKCILCRENEGFKGNFILPARQTHRVIPIEFAKDKWFLQYSPYVYYREHCIVLSEKHIPMKIDRNTFENLLEFVDKIPHYFIGSNADLPIVGGSILSHNHYQGGYNTFAMELAKEEEIFEIKKFKNTKVSRLRWPMSVIRLSGENKNEIINLSEHILNTWKKYSDNSVDILYKTENELHNTITPIARKKISTYELDLVLRNNRTNEKYPLGIFHPHNEVHHIKKENIGLIEVMGLAVLPSRLKEELNDIAYFLLNGILEIDNIKKISHHSSWYKYIIQKYSEINKHNVDDILKYEVGIKFSKALEHAGVFKRNKEGYSAFNKFVKSL